MQHLRRLPNLQTITIHNSHPEIDQVSTSKNVLLESAESVEPVFRYERTPDWGVPLPSKGFPADKYQQCVQTTLPNVHVHEFISSQVFRA